MSDASLRAALTQMKQELRSLATCLHQNGVIADPSILYGILQDLDRGAVRKGKLPWQYSVAKVELSLDPLHVRWPEKPSKFVCILDLSVGGQISDPPSSIVSQRIQKGGAPAKVPPKVWTDFRHPGDSTCWSIENLASNVELIAHAGGEVKWEQYWHFDRHITAQAAIQDSEPLEVHPLFHFHFGGDRLADKRLTNPSAWGNLLELRSPRIAHPPLDLVLLIDFVLANFSGRSWQNLVANEKEYSPIVEAAQRRFWCPYKCASGSYFGASRHEQGTHVARELWPSLVQSAG